MAVRFAQHADRLVRDGADQVSWDSYTVLFFFQRREDTGNYQCVFSLEENANDSWHVFELDPANRLWGFLGFSVELNTNVDVNLDEWYVAAFVHTPTQVKSYVRRVVDADFTTAAAPDTNPRTFNRLVVGSDFAAEFFDGNLVGGRMWTTELTPEEIALEADSLIPIRTANLFAAYDLFDVSGKLDDTSGNDRDLSEADAGAWATEANPAVDAFTATLSSEMPGFVSAIQATGGYTATLASTMPGFSSAIQAARGESATLASVLPGFTSSIGATRGVAGQIASTMPGFTSELSAAKGVAGTLAAQMPGFTSSILAARAVSMLHPTATLEVVPGPSATLSIQPGPSATLEVG